MRKVASLSFFLLFGLTLAAAPGPLDPELSDVPDVIRQQWELGQLYLLFISEDVFRRIPLENLEQLALPPRSADAIRHAVEWSRGQTAAGRDHCSLGIMGAVIGGTPPSEGIDLLASSRYVLAGVVDRLTPGVDVAGQAATLVRVTARRILKGDGGLRVGDHVTVLDDMGRAIIGGVEICTKKQFYRLPQLGEEVVVGGNPDPVNLEHFDGGGEYRMLFVRKGIVERGAEAPEDWKPISLDELESLLRKRSIQAR